MGCLGGMGIWLAVFGWVRHGPGKGDRHVGDLAARRSLSEPVPFPLPPLICEHPSPPENTQKTTVVPFGTGTFACGFGGESPFSAADAEKLVKYSD
jgi:hypothetical protein